jgi:peptidoglycan/xylan/chitin deacetylase (PgdA/CDA1 family)
LKKYDVPATIFLATDYIGSNRLLWYDKLSWILYKAVNLPDSRRLMRFELSLEIIREVERFLEADSSGRVSILRFLVALLKVYSGQEREEVIKRLAEACRVNTWPGDKDRPMLSWEEVREMSMHGVSFGSHTMSHPVLSAIPMSEVQREIGESKRIIEEQIQKTITTFAYPYGKKEDYTDEVTKILIDEGFEYACTTTVGYEQFPVATPLKLKRRGVPPHPYLFL